VGARGGDGAAQHGSRRKRCDQTSTAPVVLQF